MTFLPKHVTFPLKEIQNGPSAERIVRTPRLGRQPLGKGSQLKPIHFNLEGRSEVSQGYLRVNGTALIER